MDHIWTPWRYTYIKDAAKNDRCVFCDALALGDDARALIVHRAKKNFIILNRFPYTTGHVMIVPFAHVADLADCDADTLAEMMALARRMESALREAYSPDGFNLGMNLGRCAGAGVLGHLHLHVLPRWAGDTNFMTVTAETRVQPEDLHVTFEKLRAALTRA
jgi:ATP adenylyltransferase